MLEQYALMLDQHCQREIAAEIRSIDYNDADEQGRMHQLYQQMLQSSAQDCLGAYAGYVAHSIGHDSPRAVVQRFMVIANALTPDRKPALRPAVEHVYQMIAYPTVAPGLYFKTAGLFGVLFDQSVHDWFAEKTFTGHTDDAFAYAQYLILIGDPAGIARFDAALRAVEEDAHTLNGLLSGLSNLVPVMGHARRDPAGIVELMRRYREDMRRGTGVDGPGSGPTPSEIVTPVLEVYGG